MPTQRTQHLNVALPDSAASSNAPGTGGEYERQLKAAQTQLEKLQHQREEIERKRREAEELANRRQLFVDGQIDLLGKLDNSVQAIDRELFDMRQEMKELEEARKTFATHLQSLQAIDPRKWRKTKMAEDIDHSLEILERCEFDYEEIAANISEGRRRGFLSTGHATSSDSFTTGLKNGLAFNLPILILGTIALIAYLIR